MVTERGHPGKAVEHQHARQGSIFRGVLSFDKQRKIKKNAPQRWVKKSNLDTDEVEARENLQCTTCTQ
jgi:hypothetical protein